MFRCASRRVADFPALQAWMQDVWLLPGVAATVDVEGVRQSYHRQLFPLNPSLIVPRGPTAAQMGLGAPPQTPRPGGGADPFHHRPTAGSVSPLLAP